MTLIIIILMCACLWAIREFIVGCWTWMRRRHYRHLYRVEETQRYFGEARESLLGLVLANKLDHQSATFQFLYSMDTFVLRRPDAYPQISLRIRSAIVDGTPGDSFGNQLQCESQSWNEDVRKVIGAHARAINNLIYSHSRILRYLRKVWRLVLKLIPAGRIANNIHNLIQTFIYKRENETTRQLKASQDKLNDLLNNQHGPFATV